jgi:hypothetical protein
MDSIAAEYGVCKGTVCLSIQWVEDTLTKDGTFALPGKKKLKRKIESAIHGTVYDLIKRVEADKGIPFMDAYMLIGQCVPVQICQLIRAPVLPMPAWIWPFSNQSANNLRGPVAKFLPTGCLRPISGLLLAPQPGGQERNRPPRMWIWRCSTVCPP